MPRRIAARRSAIHGTGVFALVDLPADCRVIEYRGSVITHEAADRLYAGNADSGHTFLFTLNDLYLIDGNEGGNVARWINHGCDPNCHGVLHESADGDKRRDRVMIESLRAIAAGEELTFDYGIVLGERHTPRLKQIWACRCGAANCTGTMLKAKRRR